MKRKIKSQGDMDGSCFLYSLLNTAICLGGDAFKSDRLHKESWQRLISSAYDVRDFLSGDGTRRIDHLPELVTTVIGEYLRQLDQEGEYELRRLESSPQKGDLNTLPSKKAVLLVDNGSHWFCIVDIEDSQAFLANSAVWQDNPHKYFERKSPVFKRTYNEKCSLSSLRLEKSSIYKISRL